MFKELEKINERPEPFQFYTASDLWTDDHTSMQMLAFHLNEAIDVSSRNAAFIKRSVAWIAAEFNIGRDSKIADFGCGPGLYAAPLAKHGAQVTGIDASSKMLEIARSRFPGATWINRDMREMQLGEQFDGIVSWDAFFHLTQEEQRRVLLLFADHLSADGALLLTIGHESGEVTGTVEGEEVYHSSLAPSEYKAILNTVGFEKIEIELEDERCGFHSILLAKRG